MDIEKLTKISIFTALVFVATFIIRVPIAATGGYFNLGDSAIYVAALLFGPLVGGIVGGIGAAIADIIGYPIFVPGTLIIKLCEGVVTGYAGNKLRSRTKSVVLWKALSVVLGVGLGAATYYIGTNYMAVFGNAQLDQVMWAAVALFLGAFIILLGFMPQTQTSWQTTSIILGGATMVAGYFIYENLLAALIPALGIFAIGEIPANIGQMLVGMTIALPVLRAVQRILPPEQRGL
ncbi:MAG: ECF transporter S component [Candidatus Bathyarchaeota archaeon]|nr:ECF transporter S component [Candidatus Bathyarchaeota archaeon]